MALLQLFVKHQQQRKTAFLIPKLHKITTLDFDRNHLFLCQQKNLFVMKASSLPRSFLIIVLLTTISVGCQRQTSTQQAEESAVYKELSVKRVNLPNCWSLTAAGKSVLNLDDLPPRWHGFAIRAE